MDLLSRLADTSVLGIVLAISFVAIYFLYREIKSLQEKRVKDAETVRDSLIEPLKDLQNSNNLTVTLLQKIVERQQ